MIRRQRWPAPATVALLAAIVTVGVQATAGAEDTAADEPQEKPFSLRESLDELPFHLGGFLDARAGTRVVRDHHQLRESLLETRLQLDAEHEFESGAILKIRPDFLFDPVPERQQFDLEEGRGWLDLREANILLMPTDWMDVKVGRQILTWGTGDLVFLNDLFPKDWKSFFIGRDVEYLKAPSDAVKVSTFGDLVNFDVVFTPRFDPDRYIEGDRISYWNVMQQRRSGTFVHVERPDDWVCDSETAWRFSKNLKGYETAVYGYYGFWKSPEGFNSATGKATFPRLSAYGMSFRGAVGKGIGNFETAFYDSHQDRPGDDPFVPNSQMRYLVGYTQEIGRDFTMGLQYYVEQMLDHAEYESTRPAGAPLKDAARHVLTLRLTKLLMNQNLTLSMFAYYSPSDGDAYLRPHVQYKLSDAWTAEAGANAFFGTRPATFFSQFRDNSNLYAALRYSF